VICKCNAVEAFVHWASAAYVLKAAYSRGFPSCLLLGGRFVGRKPVDDLAAVFFTRFEFGCRDSTAQGESCLASNTMKREPFFTPFSVFWRGAAGGVERSLMASLYSTLSSVKAPLAIWLAYRPTHDHPCLPPSVIMFTDLARHVFRRLTQGRNS